MRSSEIRELFLQFFENKGHSRVASASLLPQDDPTLMFVNSGMVPFKEVFIGNAKRPYTRAVSCQRSVRAGGKHNDLEEVGYTRRHHTLFEMLGNFSFGDYFKEEAIAFAWEFVTGKLKLPLNRLYITVFREDDDAQRIWESLGVPSDRIYRFDEKDNFWSMGDTGPCGPCSEIFYDLGPEAGTGPEDVMGGSGDRFLEFWNLVFMQYETRKDGSRIPLPKPSIDTGMGLERISAIMQGKTSNYDSDIFTSLLQAISQSTGATELNPAQQKTARQVIADHARASTFLIADGVLPSNIGRGYVLRRILRRAIRYTWQLGIKKPFLYELSHLVMQEMQKAHPVFEGRESFIQDSLRLEEESFLRTVEKGLGLLDEEIRQAEAKKTREIPASSVFKLYDTFGFPADLTKVILKDRQLNYSEEGFHSLMEEQKDKARKAQKFGENWKWEVHRLNEGEGNVFVGYTTRKATTKVLSYATCKETDLIKIVLESTPFYAESGGQTGDVGILRNPLLLLKVVDCQKEENQIVHHCEIVEGNLELSLPIEAEVDSQHRQEVRKNHTAVHLLQGILREKLGDHIQQAGSFVDASRFRFDFSHNKALSESEITEIEQELFRRINGGKPLKIVETDLASARKMGALCPFGEKYGDVVRVIDIPGYSMEFCGGTHVQDISEIGLVKIIAETSISAGVRRIEGIVSQAAHALYQKQSQEFEQLARIFRTKDTILPQINELQDQLKEKEKELEKARLELLMTGLEQFDQKIEILNQKRTLTLTVKDCEAKALKMFSDSAMQKLSSGVLFLFNQQTDKISVICRVSEDLVQSGLDAAKILAPVAEVLGGRGGGKKNMAQAGGTRPESLPEALKAIKQVVSSL